MHVGIVVESEAALPDEPLAFSVQVAVNAFGLVEAFGEDLFCLEVIDLRNALKDRQLNFSTLQLLRAVFAQ